MKKDVKKTAQRIGFHVKILLKGCFKMLYGAVMAGVLASGVYGFVLIPSEGGYAAVGDFLVASCLVCIALAGTYIMGGTGKKGAKK